MKIGGKIRRFRKESGLTLDELSQKSGIALATLSRIENEKMTGTIDSHMEICRVLGITLSRLYEGIDGETTDILIHKNEMHKEVFMHNKKVSSVVLTSKALDKKMMPVIIKIAAGGATDSQECKIGTEKFTYVLEGNIEAVIGTEKYELTKGDTLYFNGSLGHYFKNRGDVEARCLVLTSPPSI